MTYQNSSDEGGELIRLQNDSVLLAFSIRKGKLSSFKEMKNEHIVLKDNLTICVKPAFSGNGI
jgi:hypothetical protein